jgi:hypothetical protein
MNQNYHSYDNPLQPLEIMKVINDHVNLIRIIINSQKIKQTIPIMIGSLLSSMIINGYIINDITDN